MKKGIIFTLLFLLATVVSAQVKGFPFMGISMNNDMDAVFQQLMKKGYIPDQETDGLLHGSFLGYNNVDIQLYPDESNQVCYAMSLAIHYHGTSTRESILARLESYLKENYKTKELGMDLDDNPKTTTQYLCNKNGVEGIAKISRYVSQGPLFDDETVDLAIIDKPLAIKEYSKRKHLRFMDLVLDGSLTTFKTKLQAKGYSFVSTTKHEILDVNVTKFKGNFCNYRNCQILVSSHPSNGRVFEVEVVIPRQVATPSSVLQKVHDEAVNYNKKVKGYAVSCDNINYINVEEDSEDEAIIIGNIFLDTNYDQSVKVRFTDSASLYRLF